MGHIISREGISVDPERVEVIQKIPYPSTSKDIRYFMRKINFVRKFISDFIKILKPLTEMMKKNAQIKWTIESKKAF